MIQAPGMRQSLVLASRLYANNFPFEGKGGGDSVIDSVGEVIFVISCFD